MRIVPDGNERVRFGVRLASLRSFFFLVSFLSIYLVLCSFFIYSFNRFTIRSQTLQRNGSIIWNKGTAFEATLHNNCVDEVYLQLKGDMMNLRHNISPYLSNCVLIYMCRSRLIDWQYLSYMWPQLCLYPQRWFKAFKVCDLECLRLVSLIPWPWGGGGLLWAFASSNLKS